MASLGGISTAGKYLVINGRCKTNERAYLGVLTLAEENLAEDYEDMS
jgi:hypothetical protein